jgi:hypothetical protein
MLRSGRVESAVDSQNFDRVIATSTASVTTDGAAKSRAFLRTRVSHMVSHPKATALHKESAAEGENTNKRIHSHKVLLETSRNHTSCKRLQPQPMSNFVG